MPPETPGQRDGYRLHPCIDEAIRHVRGQSEGPPLPNGVPVTLNFHPDALHQGRLMIEILAREGIYRTQFETGTSNGGLTAHPGGERWLWESRMFGTAYDNADPELRPRYGALNYLRRATGGSPRFGSAHLRLRPHVLARTTFCYPDSHLDPVDFGVADRMGLIALAEKGRALADMLDRYVEAHVHGPLILTDDVDAIVLDPSYRDTGIEAAARTLPFPVEWHPGFRMPVSRVEDCVAYRGQEVADLAASIAEGGYVTPREIGFARRSDKADPQSIKQAWHCVARFGSPE
ncbi:DUF3626 domain-containing protein [Tistlia consotensis]|nr:DUF3626 domain-containing protein [Tistlia consotensis]